MAQFYFLQLLMLLLLLLPETNESELILSCKNHINSTDTDSHKRTDKTSDTKSQNMSKHLHSSVHISKKKNNHDLSDFPTCSRKKEKYTKWKGGKKTAKSFLIIMILAYVYFDKTISNKNATK